MCDGVGRVVAEGRPRANEIIGWALAHRSSILAPVIACAVRPGRLWRR